MRSRWRWAPGIVVASMLCTACSDAADVDAGGEDASVALEGGPEDDALYPGEEWETGAPEDHGIDPTRLQEAADTAEGHDSHCFMVIQGGKVVGEWYWDGWDRDTRQDVFSATKSFTSTLVGIAQDRGLLGIDDRASDTITQWQGTDSEDVTVRNLLSNDSGREWALTTDYVGMATLAADKTRFAVELGQDHEPGTWWEYNNSAIQTLEAVLEQATDMEVGDFAREVLFEPLGMGAEYTLDDAGNATTFGGMQASCDDLARLGYLFLRNGRWAGEQIVSRTWVEEATVPSTELNSAYGYLWWLNRDGHWVEPTGSSRSEGDGKWHPGDPQEVFMALGFQGQIAFVDPTRDLVYARIGGMGDSTAAFLGGATGDLSSLAGGPEVTDIRDAVRAALIDE